MYLLPRTGKISFKWFNTLYYYIFKFFCSLKQRLLSYRIIELKTLKSKTTDCNVKQMNTKNHVDIKAYDV